MILAQADSAAPIAPSVEVTSIWDFCVKGGILMIPIGGCSIVALAVIIERLSSLRRRAIIPPDFLPKLKQMLIDHPGDRERALEYCRQHESPLANVLAAGIRRLDRPAESIEKAIAEAGQREAVKLGRFVRVLAVITAVSPLLGLLGTIFGMITAFQTVAMSGEALGRTEMLAGGIYEAMITTAAGLLVAIPALLAHHWIAARVDGLVGEIDRLTADFIEEFAHGDRARRWAVAAGDEGDEDEDVRPPVKLHGAGVKVP